MCNKTKSKIFHGVFFNKYVLLLRILKHCIVWALLVLCMQVGYAQPTSQCIIENSSQGGIVACDVTFSLLLDPRQGAVATNAWKPDILTKSTIEHRLIDYAEIWCNATAAHSRIREISVYTDGQKADFHYFAGSDPYGYLLGYAYEGSFPERKPSSVIFNSDGSTIAHEFGHSAVKIYDEYSSRRYYASNDCGTPVITDNPRDTLMEGDFLRFSYVADYPKGQDIRTAQQRCYGASAWDVLIQSAYWDDPKNPHLMAYRPRKDYFFQLGIDVPDAAQLEASENNIIYTCAAPTINWMTNTGVFVMAIDHSASMLDNQHLTTVKQVAKGAVELLYTEANPMDVAIVGFDDVARTEIAPTQLDTIENVAMIQSAIDALVADGGTDYAAALEQAQTIFSGVDSNTQKFLIVISDGETKQPDLDYFIANNISVYTVELDTEGKVVLADAIAQTKSRLNIAVAAPRLNSFMPMMFREVSLLHNNQLVKSVSFDNQWFDDMATTTTMISPMAESASFILRWDEDTMLDDFTLQTPDGRLIDWTYAKHSSTDGVSYLAGTLQAIYTIDAPLPGLWEARILGVGNFEYEVAVSSGIIAGINAGAEIILQEVPSDQVVYPEPIPILVHVSGNMPIIHADVMAQVTMPNGTTMLPLRLMDDGNAPDEIASDGLYSGMLVDYSEDGICEIKVTISNADGNALYDGTNLSYHSAENTQVSDTPPSPTPAPRFERVVYAQVDVMNTKEKFIPPPLSVQATTITTIPYLDKGSIEQEGQVVWYRFNSMGEGKRYYIQTSNLVGYDDAPMVTEVSLYEPNGEDLIETSVRYQGSDVSSIEWLAPRADDYLVAVAHAEEGRGYYELTVSEENLLSETKMAQAAQRSRSGGLVGYPLLLLLLFAVIVLYREKIHKLPSS